MRRRFQRVGTGMFEPVQIEGGARTRAILQRPPDIDRPGAEYTYPSPTLRVKPDSLIQDGSVIRTQAGVRYLVAGHSATLDWVTHHLFRCDRQVTWARYTSTTDPVTQLQVTPATPTTIGFPWVMWEKVRREFTDLTLRVDQENHLLATGENVQLNDVIEGMTVKRVNRALGVTIVELQG